jgi:hypothetical protein
MGINPSNDGKNPDVYDEKKRLKVFLVDDEKGIQIGVSDSFDFDVANAVRLHMQETRMEIGWAEYKKRSDGSIELEMTLIGDYEVKTNNIPGFNQMKGFIPAALRKD